MIWNWDPVSKWNVEPNKILTVPKIHILFKNDKHKTCDILMQLCFFKNNTLQKIWLKFLT